MEEWRYNSFSFVAEDIGEWSTELTAPSPHLPWLLIAIHCEVDFPGEQSGDFGDERNLLPLQRIKPRFLSHLPHSPFTIRLRTQISCMELKRCVRFELITAVLKIRVFWDIMLCRLVDSDSAEFLPSVCVSALVQFPLMIRDSSWVLRRPMKPSIRSRPLDSWYRAFESRWVHGCLSVSCV